MVMAGIVELDGKVVKLKAAAEAGRMVVVHYERKTQADRYEACVSMEAS